jgi:hypothetical protein
MTSLVALNTPAIQLIDGILARGQAQGHFRNDIDAIDVHMAISAFCFFRVANRHTFDALFGRDLVDSALRGHHPPCLAT